MVTENNHPTKKSASDFACTASLFAIAGPPIGAASVFLAVLLFKNPVGSLDPSTFPGLAIIAMSYVLGFVPAVIIGLLVASRGVWSEVSLRFTIAGTSVAILLPFFGHAFVATLFGSTLNIPLYLLIFKGVAVGAYPAATVCWLIASYAGWLRRLRSSRVSFMPA